MEREQPYLEDVYVTPYGALIVLKVFTDTLAYGFANYHTSCEARRALIASGCEYLGEL